jgi:hypothetical protein
MADPGERRVTGDQILESRGTGHPRKLVAAAIAEWAAGKERGGPCCRMTISSAHAARLCPPEIRSTRDVRQPY